MLYVFCGSDREQAVKKFRGAITVFLVKNLGGDIFSLEPDNFSLDQLEELIAGRGLFGQKILVTARDLLADVNLAPGLEKKFSDLADSVNVFLFLENELLAPGRRALTQAGAKIFEFKLKKTGPPKTAFNVFRLTDALGERDRQRLWLLYQEALAQGLAAEEIFWRLVWQVKTMLLVQKSGEVPPSSLKPFVIMKARRFSRNFQETELEDLSRALVSLWHDARAGKKDFAIGLERFLLAV